MILLFWDHHTLELEQKEIDENSIFKFSKDVCKAYNKNRSFKKFYFRYHVSYMKNGVEKYEELHSDGFKQLKATLRKNFIAEKFEYMEYKSRGTALSWTYRKKESN